MTVVLIAHKSKEFFNQRRLRLKVRQASFALRHDFKHAKLKARYFVLPDNRRFFLEIVGSQPTLFFLDPFGVRGIEWDTLAPILARPSTTEVLVRLHTPFLHRLAGFLRSNARSRAANIALLTRTIGSDEWVAYGPEASDEGWFVDRVLSSYVGRLKAHFSYVGAYPVRTLRAERLKYHMVFCTRHPRGAVIMSDIVYKTEERFLDQRRN